MSDQAAPAFIEKRNDSYAIVESSIAAPAFPDIPVNLVFDVGDSLSKALKEMKAEEKLKIEATLSCIFSDTGAPIDIKFPVLNGRTLWASFSPERCAKMSKALNDIDFHAIAALIRPVENYSVSDIIECLKEAGEGIHMAAKKGYGIAFFAYE